MHAALEDIAKVANNDISVLFSGESGSGKSTLARALHAMSPRRAGPLISVDCQGLQHEAPISARLFFERLTKATGGTVVLEEVGCLPRQLQAAIASLLEQHHAGKRTLDVRIVATSHRDLDRVVRESRFSADLLIQLKTIEIRVPPLRARREDILPLARALLETFTSGAGRMIAPRAERALLVYPWPGNIHELRNVMQRAVILAPSAELDLDALPPKLLAAPDPSN